MKNILIIGAGPAGSTTAIFLAQKGFAPTIVERKGRDEAVLKVGESIPPSAKVLLEQMDIWTTFEQAEHLKCFGNKSYWGSDTVAFTDFINQPPGYGWHLDLSVYEKCLVDKARSLGAEVLAPAKLKEAQYQKQGWEVSWEDPEGNTTDRHFDFIVDASGRHSWLARRVGVQRRYENHQLALVTFLQSAKPENDAASLIETTVQGWWYSANIPGARMATAFLCKPSKAQRAEWLNPTGWQTLLEAAPHTLARFQANQAEWLQTPKFVAADSGILERTFGPGWIAVGDAAMTYDPIASHGLMMAQVSARDAAEAIAKHFQGTTEAFIDYDLRLGTAYYHYVKQRSEIYQSEKRFSQASYWQHPIEG